MGRMLLAALVMCTGSGIALGQSASAPAQPLTTTGAAQDAPYGVLGLPVPSSGTSLGQWWSTPDSPQCPGECVPCAPMAATRFWAEIDYLLWQIKGDRVPPLVTTSPPGTPAAMAGVLSTPGVATLFGGALANDWQSGARKQVGYWLDCEGTWGVQASFFMLGNAFSSFAAGSGGTPILARPFFNVATGKADAELVAFPGIVAGSVAARDTASLFGAGAWLRHQLCCGDCFRVDALLGYRYLSLTGQLSVQENLVSTDPASKTVPVGTRIDLLDSFYTTNAFNGGDFGLTGVVRRGPWALQGLASIAVGCNTGAVDIGGSTTVTVPGFPPTTSGGGLLALSSNSGHFVRNRFAVVPQMGLKLGYQITPHLLATVGYDFLYWTSVMRPGGQIDTAVNPALIPPVLPVTGPTHPAPLLGATDVWVQGFSVGLAFRY